MLGNKYTIRSAIVLAIIYLFIFSYTIIHFVENEVYFQRFEGIFVGFIGMFLNRHISLDYFSITPLFNSSLQIDHSLPYKIQGIMKTESYFPNFISLFLILNYILGISPQLLIVLPLGILFIPFMYSALINTYVSKIKKVDYILATLLAIYFIIYLATTKFYGSFYVAPPAFALVLLIFICIKKYIEQERRSIYYLICCIGILSLAGYWHSMLMIVLFFILSLVIVSGFFYFIEKDREDNLDLKIIFIRITWLFLIVIIISLTFMHLWKSNYLQLFLKEASLEDFLFKALKQLFGQTPFYVPYSFNYKDYLYGRIYFYAYLFILIISSIIILLPLIISLQSKINKNKNIIFALSIIIAQVVNAIAYYKSSSINFPYVSLFFPLVGVAFFVELDNDNKKIKSLWRKIMYLCLTSMIVLSLVSNISLYITHEAGQTSFTKYKDVKASFEWLYNRIEKSKDVIVDFNLLGKYLQLESTMSVLNTEYQDLSPKDYQVMVGDYKNTPMHLKGNYFVIDHATMLKGLPIHVISERALLKPELERINASDNQDKIYEDNYISVFQFR